MAWRRRPVGTLVPAASLATARPQSEIPDRPSATRAIDRFVDLIGGRERLIDALEIGTTQPEIDRVLDLLADVRYDTLSLRRICDLAGISIVDLFAAFRSATLLKAQIAATEQIAQRLGPVVEDVLRRSAPYQETCGGCQGTGTYTPQPSRKVPNPSPGPCGPCRGTGQVTVLPDLERQKLALELAELVKRGGGISITQQSATLVTGAAGGSRAGDLERLQQVMGGILTGSLPILDLQPAPPAVDTTIVADPAPEPPSATGPSQPSQPSAEQLGA